MARKDESPKLEGFLEEHLPFFDELLASTAVPVHQRPLRAALFVVQYCVIAVKVGETDEDVEQPLGKLWFKALYENVEKWYADRYGDALNDREKVAPGVIEVFNTPFRINVPLVVVGPQEGDAVWVGFPSEVLPDEKVLDWLVSPPNLSNLGEAEQLQVVKKITEIGTAIRSIRINLMTATAPSDDLQLFIGSIPLHCDKCAELIIKADAASLALATWEMHLALEKSLKLVIRQQGETPGNIHDLLKLADKATKVAKIAVDMTALRKLPSGKEAIKARYGEGRQRPFEEVLANYRQAMGLIASITKSLKRSIVLNNARFLICNPLEPTGA